MKQRILEIITKRWKWARYRRRLDKLSEMHEFERLMEEANETIFRRYQQLEGVSRRDVQAVIDQLGLDLRGKSFFDIGPGYGSALDVARERGAIIVEHAEYNPFLFAFNRLKGFPGYQLDVRRNLAKVPGGRYDVVWIKATYVADAFAFGRTAARRIIFRYPPLERLLNQVDRLANRNGTIVFCPHWLSDAGKRRIPDVWDTRVPGIFRAHGYEILPTVEGHNLEPMWPITFYKRTGLWCTLVDSLSRFLPDANELYTICQFQL